MNAEFFLRHFHFLAAINALVIAQFSQATSNLTKSLPATNYRLALQGNKTPALTMLILPILLIEP